LIQIKTRLPRVTILFLLHNCNDFCRAIPIRRDAWRACCGGGLLQQSSQTVAEGVDSILSGQWKL